MKWDEAEHPRDEDGRFTYARLWRVVSSVADTGAGGAFYGLGRYFSTDEAHAQELLAGYRDYVSDDARLVTGRARVHNPFHVDATNTGGTLPGEIMHRALRDAGIAKPGEKLTPAQITDRLRAAGYDSVEVHQPGPINHQAGGSQLLVFDPADSEMDDDWAGRVSRTLPGGSIYDTLSLDDTFDPKPEQQTAAEQWAQQLSYPDEAGVRSRISSVEHQGDGFSVNGRFEVNEDTIGTWSIGLETQYGEREASVGEIQLAPGWRGKGIAGRWVRRLEQAIRQSGGRSIWLWDDSKGFWQHMGYPNPGGGRGRRKPL